MARSAKTTMTCCCNPEPKARVCTRHLSQQLECGGLLPAQGAPLHRTQQRQRVCGARRPGRRHRRRVPHAAGRVQHARARQRIHLSQEIAQLTESTACLLHDCEVACMEH